MTTYLVPATKSVHLIGEAAELHVLVPAWGRAAASTSSEKIW